MSDLSVKKGEESMEMLRVGKDVFVRTVTYHYIGRIKEINEHSIVLSDASWIPQSGRWSTTLSTGELKECEPYVDDVYLNRQAVVDITAWRFALPTKAK